MKISKLFVSFLAISLLLDVVLTAQTTIITADEFVALSKSNDALVLIDANKSKNYQASHIKGALHVNHLDLYQDGDVAGLIKSPEELAVFFGKLGVGENSTIVLTDDGSQKYNSRVYWILKYIGAKDVRLLHKDLNAWRKARLPMTATPGKATPTTFTPSVNPEILVDIAYLKENKDAENVVLVDCRTPAEYKGEKSSDGHIPGAINIDYVNFLTETGAFKSVEELTVLAEAKGLNPEMEVILYCKTSVRATPAFVALANILGYKRVRVYDGAYNEWVANYPVVQ